MINFVETGDTDYIHFEVSETITEADVNKAMPLVETHVKNKGCLKAIVQINNLKGYSFLGLVKDMKFALNHWNDAGRMAILGDAKIKQLVDAASTFIMMGKMKYFKPSELDNAKKWLKES